MHRKVSVDTLRQLIRWTNGAQVIVCKPYQVFESNARYEFTEPRAIGRSDGIVYCLPYGKLRTLCVNLRSECLCLFLCFFIALQLGSILTESLLLNADFIIQRIKGSR